LETILEREVFSFIHRKLASSSLLLPQLLKIIDLVNQDYYPSWYKTIFFQDDYYPKPFTLYDSYLFYWLHVQLGLGNIVYAKVLIGETPVNDKNQTEINRILNKLWYPFRGFFWGGNRGEDGFICIDAPIKLSVLSYKDNEVSRPIIGRFPLEVGTTDLFKTFFYLNTGNKRLARWPYNSDSIYLLAAV
jgi:hypothetical protein